LPRSTGLKAGSKAYSVRVNNSARDSDLYRGKLNIISDIPQVKSVSTSPEPLTETKDFVIKVHFDRVINNAYISINSANRESMTIDLADKRVATIKLKALKAGSYKYEVFHALDTTSIYRNTISVYPDQDICNGVVCQEYKKRFEQEMTICLAENSTKTIYPVHQINNTRIETIFLNDSIYARAKYDVDAHSVLVAARSPLPAPQHMYEFAHNLISGVELYTDWMKISSGSFGDKRSLCEASIHLNFMPEIAAKFRRGFLETAASNLKLFQEAESTQGLALNQNFMASDALAKAKFRSNVVLGLNDGLMAIRNQQMDAMSRRASISFAISRTVGHFITDDLEVIEQLAELPQLIDELNNSLTMYKEIFRDTDLESLLGPLVTLIENSPEGGWLDSFELEKVITSAAFKETFAKAIGLDLKKSAGIRAMSSPEFAYILGSMGGEAIVEIAQKFASLKALKEIQKKAGKAVAGALVKTLGKSASIIYKASNKGFSSTEKLMLTGGNPLTEILSFRDTLNIFFEPDDVDANALEAVSLDFPDIRGNALRCGTLTNSIITNYPTSCFVLNGTKIGHGRSFKYAVTENSSFFEKNYRALFLHTTTAKIDGCQVHHIIPQSLKLLLKVDTNNYFAVNDQSNLMALPMNDTIKSKCARNGKAVIHNGYHSIYNKFVSAALREDDGVRIIDVSEMVIMREMLRAALSAGRGLFPIYKKELSKDPLVEKNLQRRRSTNTIQFMIKYYESVSKV
ncbi:hypothetical protein EMM73_06585, partial [Rheinheimera sediminis]|uniref:AHH domain-containing protein n=1 Tax=Rheinheimera sp. YQF-1 TaxID=2499626 RepID=UPI000FE0F24C